MDPFRLLSRSTRLSKSNRTGPALSVPLSGQSPTQQLFSEVRQDSSSTGNPKKRKREDADGDKVDVEFFGRNELRSPLQGQFGPAPTTVGLASTSQASGVADDNRRYAQALRDLPLEEKKRILNRHKLKVTWLNPFMNGPKNRRKAGLKEKREKQALFPSPLVSFQTLKHGYNIPDRVALNIDRDGYKTPTDVQMGALPLLVGTDYEDLREDKTGPLLDISRGIDLLTVAPTGSGKTLAYLIPLIHAIVKRKQERKRESEKGMVSAIILAPTKELAGQIVNEGRKIADGTGLRISQARKGMQLDPASITHINDDDGEGSVIDTSPEVNPSVVATVKSDILVSTPGILQSIVGVTGEHGRVLLPTVRHLIMDEADVLLDPLFRQQSLAIWNTLTSPDLRVGLWSATMGSNIEELTRAQIHERRSRLLMETAENHAEAPLIRLVVGLKDSAVPNIQHRLIYAASEQGKLLSLRQILHPTAVTDDASSSLMPPFLVFAQTIERAVALHAELLYDIPVEAGGGLARIAVLHADLSDAARDHVMAGFRRGEIWVLITTDLLARGVDFRGVNGVVNYDIPTSSAAYVHRAGRTGRAGRAGGVAITLYTKDDIPFLKNIANVVAATQTQFDGGIAGGGNGVQPWLLEALPSLSKRAKRDLKKRGVEARTAKGRDTDPKAARRARISTKAGFVRRAENRRRAAIAEAQRRRRGESVEGGDASGSEFGGFN